MATFINVPVKRILVIALLALIGCKDSDKNSSLIFEELNESLERSIKNLELSTIEAINSLESKKQEPVTAERANVWFSRAYSIVENSNKIIGFIDSTQQAVVKMNDDDRRKYSEGLDSMLRKYQDSILAPESYERKYFYSLINFHPIKSKKEHRQLFSLLELISLKFPIRILTSSYIFL